MAAAGELKLFEVSEGHRGIPEAIFLDSVDEICESREPTDVVKVLQELYTKYQYMQTSLAAQRASLRAKLPDISSALETVNHMVEKREKGDAEGSEYTYQLAENIWSKATVKPSDSVCLWLGANCMLEYTLEEALELLRTNEANAKTTLKTLDEDVAFLRDQITTTEVNIARTHNLGVRRRQQDKAEGKDAQPAPGQAPVPAPAGKAAPANGEGKHGAVSYTWEQSNQDIEVAIAVPEGATKDDVKVTILTEKLRVEHSGKVLFEGELASRCSPSESTWTMAGSKVEIHLQKAEEKMWPSLLEQP